MMQGTSNHSTVVLKFGGTSVKDAEAMRRVVSIVERERGRRPVVVTSACAGVTDALLECARLSGLGDEAAAMTIAEELRQRHLGILRDLCGDQEPGGEPDGADDLRELLDRIAQLVRGVTLLGELTPRTIDHFAGFGERLSSILLTAAFTNAGWRAARADSRGFIVTDACFGSARPLMDRIDRQAPARILPLLDSHDVVIAQGFIGRTEEGIDTTIGRGGSDHTGALIGAALGSREIQIWTDVSGILTADPRLVPTARVVPEVTFTEARELAYFGAKVIHPDTILPAVERSIPVVIKNSMRPDDSGTRILPDGSDVPAGIHSVTMKRGMTVLKLAPRDAREGSASVEEALGVFANRDVPMQCALLAESRGLVAVPSSAVDDILLAALESRCLLAREENVALLCLTGASLQATPGVLGRAFEAFDEIPITFVAAGTSEHIVLVGVPDDNAVEALATVHEGLFGR